jgi:uncharacterized protein YeaO (DUF488 family)
VPGDGCRHLVDQPWPGGLGKGATQLDAWLKDQAPSEGLRRWFGHDVERREQLQECYWRELEGRQATLEEQPRWSRSFR